MSEPLADGVDSVNWLPSLENQKSDAISTIRDGAQVLPFFPLGGIVYTPHSTHVLNIFEPRYRKMYNDILMNGSKRFVVAMAHPEEKGMFAETGVIFYLEDLREVSEMTADQIKYICSHKVTGRVKIHRVINPEVWATNEDYMKVEATILEEEDENSDKAQLAAISEEQRLKQSYADLVKLQHDLSEDVRFTMDSVSSLSVDPGGGDDSLWLTVRLWQSYIEQRLNARQSEMQKEFQEKLIKFLKKEQGIDEKELPSAIGFQELSPDLQKEVTDLQQRMIVELEPLVLESTLTMQKILETDEHKGRVNLVRYFVDAEKKRLEARKVLQNVFGDKPAEGEMIPLSEVMGYSENEDVEEIVDDDDDEGGLFNDSNAFQ